MGPILVTIYAMPWILFVLFPLTIIYANLQARYRHCSRDLKRIGKKIYILCIVVVGLASFFPFYINLHMCILSLQSFVLSFLLRRRPSYYCLSCQSYISSFMPFIFYFLCGLKIPSLSFPHYFICVYLYLFAFFIQC